jgi:hypothetical protein
LGAIAAGEGALDRAARLMGAAENLRRLIGVPIPPLEAPDYERRIEAMEDEMGGERFRRDWAVGRAMNFDDALTLAFGSAGTTNGALTEAPGTRESVRTP